MAESSQPSDPGGKVEIKVLQATKLARLGKLPFREKFCAELSLGNQTSMTKMKSRAWFGLRSKVQWNENFTFVFAGQMPNLTLRISAGKSNRRDIFIGQTVVSYATLNSGGLPEIGTINTYDFPLSDENGHVIAKPKVPTLKVVVKIISTGIEEHVDDLGPVLEQAEQSIQQASEALGRLKGPEIPGIPVGEGTSGSGVAGTAGDIGSILGKIGTIADIMDELTKVHPYAKAVWDILDLTRKVIKAQMREDDSIRELSDQMRFLLDRIQTFVEKLDSISPSDIHTDEKYILHRVSTASRDCARFIIGFCDKNFGKRAMKCALFGDASKEIEKYKSKFESLEKSFNEKVWDGTSLLTRQILENQKAHQVAEDQAGKSVQRVLDNQAASHLDKYIIPGASLLASDKPSCFTGTRTAIREAITAWISRDDEDVPRVLLLSGMAGTGKSTIAVTIARNCPEQSRLGASFAFNRRAQPRPAPRELFPHIAASLAALYPAVKNVFSDTQKKEIASGSDLEGQLLKLIIEPLNQSNTPTGLIGVRIVIAIDAFDEADDDREQTIKLASLLATQCSKLPSNIRILVTTRPEADVLEEMPPHAVLRLSMPDSSEINMFDVGLFVRDQLLSRPLEGIDEECCAKIAETSQGLFQWAATACKVIKPPLPMGSTSRKGYDMVITSGVGRDKSGLLDSLYKGVLERIGNPDKNPDGHQLLKEVLAMLFVLMEPMALENLRQLYVQLRFGEGSDVDSTLSYLASILDGISDETRPVQPNHTSLRDFFLDPGRSGSFCVKSLLSEAHDRIARASFEQMSASLDICNLDFNRSDNFEYVKSEADRVQRDMFPNVAYTILYWVKHLAKAPAPQEAIWTDVVMPFLADDRALRWIELFSLLAIHRLGHVLFITTPELSGCTRLLAHVTKQEGSSCPDHVQALAELLSTIVTAQSGPSYSFRPINTLLRLGVMYRMVGRIVKLRHQLKDGSLVPAGSGFFVALSGASYDVIVTTAHSLVDADGQTYTDLVVHIPKQIPRLNGSSEFSDVQCPVPPTDIHVCADFYRERRLETDWGAILLPRGTALRGGFRFDTQSEDFDRMCLGIYGRPSWVPHLSGDNTNNLADITPTDSITHLPCTKLGDPVASGAPTCAFDRIDYSVRGIFNPTYGNEAHTKITPALARELGSWVGLIDRHNTQLRLIPRIPSKAHDDLKVHTADLCVPPNWENLYLFVNEEEGSRLCLRRGSGSSFEVSFLGIDGSSFSLGLDYQLVKALDKDRDSTDSGGRLACVSASDYKGGRALRVRIDQRVDEDQQTSRETMSFHHSDYFDVENTPITSSSHGELFKIVIRPWGSAEQQGSTRFDRLKFALE